MIWLKLVHFATIAIWSGGLICLPGLYMQRIHVTGQTALHRLHAMVRFLYVAVISPSAFIAVGSGTALIFMRHAFEGWFALKLALVGLLVGLHLFTGLVVIRLFERENAYPAWRFSAVAAATLTVVVAILVVVLAKPHLPEVLPGEMAEPGGLQRLAGRLNPFRR